MSQDPRTADRVGLADLGVADTGALTAIVARSLDVEGLELQGVSVDEVPYDLLAITTRHRVRVSGIAVVDGAQTPFSIFVKVVQSWEHSPAFQFVPEELRAAAAVQLPWRVEPQAYQSALPAALPAGLRMPTAYAVIDLDDTSAAIWLEDIEAADVVWTIDHYRRAAVLLGRFAARTQIRAAIRSLDPLIGQRTIREYVGGRVALQVVPALRSDELWTHPLVAGNFGPALRARLLRLGDAVPGLLDELDTLPAGVCHGDACTRNLLISRSDPELVLIDFGFLRYAPLGFDVSQLILGEIQLGERDPDQLTALSAVALGAYVEGLRLEGSTATIDQVSRAQAITMAIFSGLTAIPFELLGEPPSDRANRVFAARAQLAGFILDRVGC